MSEKENLERMLAASAELEFSLRLCAGRAVSPYLRDELQKLTAAAAGHSALIRSVMEGGDSDGQ